MDKNGFLEQVGPFIENKVKEEQEEEGGEEKEVEA